MSESEEPTSKLPLCHVDSREHEEVQLKICYGKQKYDVNFPLDETVEVLKKHVEKLTDVPAELQKIMFRGLMDDGLTLRQQKVTNGARIMVIGSTVQDILAVADSSPADKNVVVVKLSPDSDHESLCKQKCHKTVLERFGRPDDLMPTVIGSHHPLSVPISGLYNKHGHKVRLTLRRDSDEFWIGTKERTQKLILGSVTAVHKGPIEDSQGYYIMGLQLGPTTLSCYWLYWVPAQYVRAIAEVVTGKSQNP